MHPLNCQNWIYPCHFQWSLCEQYHVRYLGPPHKPHTYTQLHINMPRDHAQRMYEEAFLPVSCRSGTPYPCAQSEIDITNSHNVYPYVGGTQTTEYGAAQEIVGHNSMYRVPGSLEEEAIINLQYMRRALRAQHDEFGPDLAIKVFRDLDRVFFAGKLYGRCSVQWDDLDEVYATAYSLLRRPGVALILLSVRGIILMTPKDAMLRQLFKTLLHEMCVSDYSGRSRVPSYKVDMYIALLLLCTHSTERAFPRWPWCTLHHHDTCGESPKHGVAGIPCHYARRFLLRVPALRVSWRQDLICRERGNKGLVPLSLDR